MTPDVATELTAALAGAAQVYVGVSTSGGPHVTPELFTVAGGRIICMTAAPTVKSRRLRRHRSVACAIRSDTRCVSLVGRATVIDPASPATLLRAPRRAVTASLDAAHFTAANLVELSGAAVDLLTGRLGRPIPPHRVVIIIEPQAAAITDRATVRSESGWAELSPAPSDAAPAAGAGRAAASRGRSELPDVAALPDGLAGLTSAGQTVVGWNRVDGTPLAFAAAWDHERAVATIAAELFDLIGAARASSACAAFDAWSGFGPSGKQGLMLRGTGHAVRVGTTMELRCTIDRATYWRGTATGSIGL
ncbi:MAG: hypothetical protein M3Z46_01755 [Actinomycetota bacterium]|nr:hypothetical protein [Actinomycetota bacterium]